MKANEDVRHRGLWGPGLARFESPGGNGNSLLPCRSKEGMVVMRLSISTRLFYSHFLVVLLVSGAIGSYFYITALDSLLYSIQARLKNSAALLSPSLDATSLDAIRGPEDSVQPAYQRMLRTLRDHASSNADIAFIYIMRRENGRVSFVVDSDDSPQQAVPGKTLSGRYCFSFGGV